MHMRISKPARIALTIGLIPFALACAGLTVPPTAAPVLPTGTPAPTSTATLTPSATASATATPLPAWIDEFAEPVLQAIAGRAPKFQDDFGSLAGGWYNGATSGHPDVQIDGEKRVVDGEYRIIANAATTEEPNVCSGVEDGNVGHYSDFVAEFDVRFVSGEQGEWMLQFHRSSLGFYSLSVSADRDLAFGKCDQETCGWVVSYRGDLLKAGLDWNHILLIARGAKMTAYANGSPVLYYEDFNHTDVFEKGYFSLNVCHSGTVPMETRWDNFRVWDISDLP